MKTISTILLDVDGTLTDGKIYYSEAGDEMKAFHIKDGLILSALHDIGYEIVVVTGRKSRIVEKRMKELGITEIYQGISDKNHFFEHYLTEKNLSRETVCCIGDDLNDMPVMKKAYKSACPADACEEVKAIVDYISKKNGGDGAVRDILEYFLRQSNKWESVLERYGLCGTNLKSFGR